MSQEIIIVGRTGGSKGASRDGIGEKIRATYEYLTDQQNLKVFLEEETAINFGIVGGKVNTVVGDPSLLPQTQDYMIIVFGGDGTMLNACKKYASLKTTFLGVNQGRVGFITDLPVDIQPWQISSIIRGNKYTIEPRTMIGVSGCTHAASSSLDDSKMFALNDVTVTRRDGKMVEFSVYIDTKFAYRARGDGLMMSTPTGSTAYALSAGGSIIDPCTPVFELLVMMPQSLSHRPLVFSDDKVVTVRMHVGEADVYADGNLCGRINTDNIISFSKSNRVVNFMHPTIQDHEYDYLNTLREKLNWQLSPGKA